MEIDDRFATWVGQVEELPEPFRGTVRERLSPQDSIHLLVFNPWRARQGVRSPGTLLVLTDSRWLVVSDDENGMATVVECAYDDTLVVELVGDPAFRSTEDPCFWPEARSRHPLSSSTPPWTSFTAKRSGAFCGESKVERRRAYRQAGRGAGHGDEADRLP